MSAWGTNESKMKEMKQEGNEGGWREGGWGGGAWRVRDGHALLSIQSRVFRG